MIRLAADVACKEDAGHGSEMFENDLRFLRNILLLFVDFRKVLRQWQQIFGANFEVDVVAQFVAQAVQVLYCRNAVVLVRNLEVRKQRNLLAKRLPCRTPIEHWVANF